MLHVAHARCNGAHMAARSAGRQHKTGCTSRGRRLQQRPPRCTRQHAHGPAHRAAGRTRRRNGGGEREGGGIGGAGTGQPRHSTYAIRAPVIALSGGTRPAAAGVQRHACVPRATCTVLQQPRYMQHPPHVKLYQRATPLTRHAQLRREPIDPCNVQQHTTTHNMSHRCKNRPSAPSAPGVHARSSACSCFMRVACASLTRRSSAHVPASPAQPCRDAPWLEGKARHTPQLGDLRSLCGDGRVERGDRPVLGGARGAQRALELCSPELALPWATTGPAWARSQPCGRGHGPLRGSPCLSGARATECRGYLPCDATGTRLCGQSPAPTPCAARPCPANTR
jgi:hypothetical protein